ncbi:MAG: energy transducer TonB [Mariprofundus sp.]
MRRFWPWLVASAAIHGLLLVLWLDNKLPGTADEVVLELVSVDLQPEMEATLSAISRQQVRKDITPKLAAHTAINKPELRQILTVSPRNMVADKPAVLPSNAKAETETSLRRMRPGQQIKQTFVVTGKEAQEQSIPQYSSHKPAVADIDKERMLVRNHLEAFKYYPASARRRGIEGHVEVGFILTRHGEAGQVSVLHGSGYAVLDHAALETIYRAQPFPVEDGKYRFSLKFKRL